MINVFDSVMGFIITDKKNNKIYLFSNDKTKYMTPTIDVMEELSDEYKGTNIMCRPYCILVYEQVFKNRSYGIKKKKTITQAELTEILSNKEYVENN